MSTSGSVNILIVDDIVQNLYALKEILNHPSYTLITATSGSDALRYLLREDFAVILLDVAMPGMDGFELARIVKQRPRSADTPIIFLTALKKEIANVYQGYLAGAVDYLEKPLDPEIVKAKVGVFVELYRKRVELERKTEQVARQAELLRESERREQEYRIAELHRTSEERYRNLADLIPQIVWRATPYGEATYLNRRWEACTGLANSRGLGLGWHDVIHVDDVGEFKRVWTEAKRSHTSFEVECRLRQPDATYRWFLCQAVPERADPDHESDWLGTFTDIAAQKQIEADRVQLLQKTQEAVQLRDDFLSVASHELKTPLTSLSLQLQMLERSASNPERWEQTARERVNKSVGIIMSQITRLTNLVGELLDVSVIASGRLSMAVEQFDMADLVDEVVRRFHDAGQAPNLHYAGVKGVVGAWDRSRIDQVATNLISNALKYGAEKPVDVELRRDGDTAVLVVRDQGIGISKEHQYRIFERFERAVTGRAFSGLGLGLYIVREIVAAHGGRIEVESEEGKGSTFRAYLPLTQAEGAKSEPTELTVH